MIAESQNLVARHGLRSCKKRLKTLRKGWKLSVECWNAWSHRRAFKETAENLESPGEYV
jgi:hypothetical protein